MEGAIPMSYDPRNARFAPLVSFPAIAVLGLALVAIGCGSSEEETEQFESQQAVSPTASLEYKVDSLKNETRRLKEQLDAMAAENRNLTAHSADLETRLTDASKAPAPAPAGDVMSAYTAALDQFNRRNYSDAAQQFQAILSSGTDRFVDNCHYWIGESYYGLRKYNEAIKEFETVLGFTGSGKRPYAQLMIGNSYAMLGDRASAREAYDKVVSTYPSSEVVEKAKEKIAKFR
jgi:tol-pal system protein YbgF